MPCSRDRIKRVTSYIQENVSKKITLKDLACHSCLSLHYFSRMFREATGRSPQQYVREARVDCAKCRLKEGVAIAMVAFMCGFSSQAHLTRIFKSHTGMTPAQFQRSAIRPTE